ncbi:hypothetical protein [Mesorhizobium erdmanii]|uniref:hypothetical protein n=1 Tax=Mesorhizobium erdmanii TaxID=1777866 RepID=UPI0012B5E64F|nr:hypothetical protein [Mesorhizobium erdmanii]
MDNHFGDGAFAFQPWKTPFENSDIELVDVAYSEGRALIFRVRAHESGSIYRVCFEHVSAFRVLDEHGLLELWEKTRESGGRPARTTFQVRNHLWTKESTISFVTSDGWSYVVASHFDCVEVVTANLPSITLEA